MRRIMPESARGGNTLADVGVPGDAVLHRSREAPLMTTQMRIRRVAIAVGVTLAVASNVVEVVRSHRRR
jgi:hypothetical protein